MDASPHRKPTTRSPLRILAGLLVVLALAASLAPAAAIAEPSAANEYKLNLQDNGKSNGGSDDGGGFPVVPVVIAAGAVTVLAVFLLSRNRKRNV